uniref:Uncharacterized protein n=1 Tax=Cannabis sativa TaxID=3483 RepID=A0A803Q6G8_CANSA
MVKDDQGNFYPLFGIWLKKDAQEKSTFTMPLPKWFQGWVMQKRLGKDPMLRNQVKVQKALRNGEKAEIRECRMQFPGKRRIVSDSDEESDAPTAEEVITQLPLIYLPGIGEFAPFGNNSKKVSVSDLIEAAAEYARNTSKNKAQKRNKFERNTNQNGPPSQFGLRVKVDSRWRKATLEAYRPKHQIFPFWWNKLGCDLSSSSSKRQGRPRKQTHLASIEDDAQPKRRGRPPKSQNGLSVTPKPFKWRNKSKSTTSMGATITNLWESKAFDLKVDLHNRFVVIENTGLDITRCKITELNEDNTEGHSSKQPQYDMDFCFGGYGDLPGKVSTVAMKILAWNCRGLGNATTVRQLTVLVRQHQPEMVL